MVTRSMKIRELAVFLKSRNCNGIDLDTAFNSVSCDSRDIHKGDVFFAYQGPEVDGHDYIGVAFEQGAVAAVVTDPKRLGTYPGLLVDHSMEAFSSACSLVEGHPSHSMKVVGITGTNGKTTIHYMLYHALNRLESPCIRIGSLGIEAEMGHIERSGKVQTLHSGEIVMTTPGPKEIHMALNLALKAGVKTCVLETSSHAIHQKRVSSVQYDVALFTNLTPDHLNYHPDMETYFEVKSSLFNQLDINRRSKKESSGGAVINVDCPYGEKLFMKVKALDLPIFSFGHGKGSSVCICDFTQGIPRSVLKLTFEGKSYDIQTSLIGDYNGSNLAGAFAVLVSLGFSPKSSAVALSDLPVVPGRLEPVGSDDIPVFVDYAHTGVGLENVLKAVKNFVQGDLWVLFGCGGGKDPRKRIDMGRAAKLFADKIVLTDDNPKLEDPDKIIQEILQSGCQPECVIHDRAKAIEATMKAATKGDVIILAGKGHEDYQIFGSKTYHFSDQEEVLKAKKNGLLKRS